MSRICLLFRHTLSTADSSGWMNVLFIFSSPKQSFSAVNCISRPFSVCSRINQGFLKTIYLFVTECKDYETNKQKKIYFLKDILFLACWVCVTACVYSGCKYTALYIVAFCFLWSSVCTDHHVLVFSRKHVSFLRTFTALPP